MGKKVKSKYYVVWEGNSPGIYNSWEECLLQVKAYPNAKYKAYDSIEDAKDAFVGGYSSKTKILDKRTVGARQKWQDFVPEGSITVDAACEGNPGKMEYRGVDPYTGQEIFHIGPLANGTNNIGEFLALVHALALFKNQQNNNATIFTDSMTAISWIKRKKANTKLAFDYRNKEIKDLLVRATQWLMNNSFSNPIKKWETDKWGEIPADFGRK